MTELRACEMEYLVRMFDERLLSRPAGGGRREVRPGLVERIGASGFYPAAGVSLAAAFLASPAGGDNPLRDHPALWGLALELGERLRGTIERGLAGPRNPPHFPFRTFPRLYELAADRLTAARRRSWGGTIRRYVDAATAFLKLKRPAWGRPGPYTGTGPNHLYQMAAQIAWAGRILGGADWRRFARTCMRALCRLQSPEGYFPEHSGPAVSYQMVYLNGLGDYVGATGDRQVRGVLERLADFIARAMYPDLTPLATIDQRNRRGHRPGGRLAGCAWTPAGRGVALAGVRRALDDLHKLDRVAQAAGLGPLTMAVLQCPPGAAGAVPARRRMHHDAFDGLAVVGRRGGWFHALSGYHQPPQTYNPYQFDRTENVSIYHDACGLIVGGGNDKFAPEAATIELREGGEVFYFPPVSASASGSAGGGRLRLEYGPASAELRVRVVSARLLELTAAVKTNFCRQRNRLNLQLPLTPRTALIADGREVVLPSHAEPLQIVPVRRRLTRPGAWTIETDGPAELHWPHVPYACYSGRPNRGTLASAVAFLRLELDGAGSPRVVRLHVPPRGRAAASRRR